MYENLLHLYIARFEGRSLASDIGQHHLKILPHWSLSFTAVLKFKIFCLKLCLKGLPPF